MHYNVKNSGACHSSLYPVQIRKRVCNPLHHIASPFNRRSTVTCFGVFVADIVSVMLISIIASDSDTIGDTFEVSLSVSAIVFYVIFLPSLDNKNGFLDNICECTYVRHTCAVRRWNISSRYGRKRYYPAVAYLHVE